jgi:lysozyme family protein
MTAAEDRFAACADIVMGARGAFVAHDPLLEGPSAHGVGLGLLSVWVGGPADAGALRTLTADGAARILRSMVWAPIGAARLPAGVDLALFAYALDAGTMRAMTDLQAELDVAQSGAADAATLAAAAARDPSALARAVAAHHAAWRAGRGLALPSPTRPPGRRAMLPA